MAGEFFEIDVDVGREEHVEQVALVVAIARFDAEDLTPIANETFGRWQRMAYPNIRGAHVGAESDRF